MGLPELTPKELFPILKQMVLDTYKVESYYFSAPYDNFDILDMGFRKMIWGTYSTNSDLFFSMMEDHPYQIVIVESSLHFHNIIILFGQDSSPDFISFGPFCTETASATTISKIMKDNQISPKYFAFIQQFYFELPIVNIDDFIPMVRHFIMSFIPTFENCPIEHISYSSRTDRYEPSDDRIIHFNSNRMEVFAKKLRECLDSITAGNSTQSVEKMKSLLDSIGVLNSGTTLHLKNNLLTLNTMIATRFLDTSVHPAHIVRQLQSFNQLINGTNSAHQLHRLPFEMARKYSMLAKNYAFEEYSYLIRNVINYIDQHLASDLTLSVLSEEFQKNPSYLSNAFKKEVGETLTGYINKQRMHAAIRYFNTTQMSVADVAQSVGILDFGYFSKLFKKQVGVSPREYKKMLDK